MPDNTVTISGKTITIEKFKLDKAMRVITLLKLMQQAAPEISKEWAKFRKEYAEDYGRDVPRINALALFGDSLEHVSDEQWERSGQVFRVPGTPSQAEIFFAMAPVLYEKAEQVTLRLLGLIAMPNATVSQYVGEGDIWPRVDELVNEIIRPADLDEIMELAFVAAEVIDGQVLAKARSAGDRLGNVLRLIGWQSDPKTTTENEKSSPSPTSSPTPEKPSSPSSEASPSDTTGPQTSSDDSPGTTSGASESSSLATA